MANSSVPKHDFAPAWLKIPGESQSSFHSERLSRRDDPTSGKGPSLIGRQRQSSCDQQYPRRERQHDSAVARHPTSHRHHSIDIDESQYYSSGLDEIGSHRPFGSQPSLNRRPHSRQENPFFNCSTAYRGYSLHDFSSDGPRSNGWNRHRNSERASVSQNNNSKDSLGCKELNECSTDRFNLEFPSLQGDTNDSPASIVNGGVWSVDNLRNTKIYLDTSNKKPQNNDTGQKIDGEGRSSSPGSILTGSNGSTASPKTTSLGSVINKTNCQNQLTSSVYRVLVPTKLTKKPLSKDTRTTTATLFSNKTPRQSSPTPHVEILNTQLVTHPKNLGNKKSDFLKTLRSEEPMQDKKNGYGKEKDEKQGRSVEKEVEEDFDKQQNGRDIVESRERENEFEEKPILSSSLEAEQRLLKEMGWKEEDEDAYAPLTEDELREIENLSRKMREKNALHRPTWSPKRRIPFVATASIVELDDDSCSSTSSDSE